MALRPKRTQVVNNMAGRNGNGANSTQIVPWVAVAMSLGAAFWTVANPRDDIKQLKQDEQYSIQELRKEVAASFETLAQHNEYSKRIDGVDQSLSMRTAALEAGLVPRSEHAQHWSEENEKINELRNSLQELRNQWIGTWNVGKQLDSIEKELSELRHNKGSNSP